MEIFQYVLKETGAWSDETSDLKCCAAVVAWETAAVVSEDAESEAGAAAVVVVAVVAVFVVEYGTVVVAQSRMSKAWSWPGCWLQ